MSDTGYGVKVIQAAGSSNVIGALLKHMAEGETQSENRNGACWDVSLWVALLWCWRTDKALLFMPGGLKQLRAHLRINLCDYSLIL